jgi:hypothetical protein
MCEKLWESKLCAKHITCFVFCLLTGHIGMSPLKTNFIISLGFYRDIMLFILFVCIGTVSKWDLWHVSESCSVFIFKAEMVRVRMQSDFTCRWSLGIYLKHEIYIYLHSILNVMKFEAVTFNTKISSHFNQKFSDIFWGICTAGELLESLGIRTEHCLSQVLKLTSNVLEIYLSK